MTETALESGVAVLWWALGDDKVVTDASPNGARMGLCPCRQIGLTLWPGR